MAKRGPAKAKREARYKSFLSSAAWKRIRREALERAGHQCEVAIPAREGWLIDGEWMQWMNRCAATDKLTVHHKSYARFGGDELPEDLEVQCRDCHNRLHALEGKRIA